MTNKTICHGNNVNNDNRPSKAAALNKALTTQSSLPTTTTITATITATAAAAAITKTTTTSSSSTSTSSSLSNVKSNNTSKPSQINSNKNNNSNYNYNSNNNNNSKNINNIELCPPGVYSIAKGGDAAIRIGTECNGGTGVGGAGGGGGGIIKAYAHGIWYQEYNTIDNSVQQQIQYLQRQRQRLHQHNVKGGVVVATNANGYVLHPENDEIRRNIERQHKRINGQTIRNCNNNNSNTTSSATNNNANQQSNCDIVIVDIENEPSAANPPPTNRVSKTLLSSSSHLINESLSLRNSKHNLLDETIIERQVKVAHVAGGSGNYLPHGRRDEKTSCDNRDNIIASDVIDNDDDEDEDADGDGDEDEDDGENDSSASMETLSDNVSIWIEGEKHWISGVDEQTTCADLIWALLNYQNGQPEPHHHNAIATAAVASSDSSNKGIGNSSIFDKDLQQQTSHRCDDMPFGNINSISTPCEANNQSMPVNTKEENCKTTPNLSKNVAITATTTGIAGCNDGMPSRGPPATFPLPPGITTPAQLATEYVIVKQYQHCEEYLDGSTKVCDVLPPRHSQHKKECELLLRRLGPVPSASAAAGAPPPLPLPHTSSYANNTTTPQLSSLISTDKDSGMGSPVGSARSAKFRRRKHKSSQWLSQANTLHPRLSRCTATANERLLKIILAQDETIQRQLSLLREKERQINKIEEEKHRKRERELGKNYLLETYLNGLEEAECEPEQQETEEIFIDEAYQHHLATSPIRLPSCGTSVTAHNPPPGNAHIDVETITLDTNFKPKDTKKEKKKKGHKERTNNKDEDAKKHSTSTHDSAQEKLHSHSHSHSHPPQHSHAHTHLHQRRQLNNVAANIPGSVLHNTDVNDSDDSDGGGGGGGVDGEAVGCANKAETEMQIFWWEKVYTLNKQLQKEEELAAKLNAKIRRHQLKKANQTQKEVQLEIDKLDNCLAMQCGDIRRVEANLMETNEQLQKKLLVLERLSLDYISQQEGKDTAADEHQLQNEENENCIERSEVTKQTPQVIENTTDIQQLSLGNIRSVEEVVEKLQKLIAKPSSCSQMAEQQQYFHHNGITTTTTESSSIFVQAANMENHMVADYPENSDRHLVTTHSKDVQPAYATSLISDQRLAGKTCQTPPPLVGTLLTAAAATAVPPPPPAKPSACAVTALTAPVVAPSAVASTAPSAPASSTTLSCFAVAQTPAAVLDKNMLSSLHVQNAKTIKKQMFHTQTGGATSIGLTTPPTTISAATSTASLASACVAPMAVSPTPTPLPLPVEATTQLCERTLEINALPLQHYDQQDFNTHMVHAMASSSSSSTSSPAPSAPSLTTPALMTLRPQNAYQKQNHTQQQSQYPHPPPPPSAHHQMPHVFLVNRPPAVGVASLAPIQATMAVAAAAAAAASISSSSSPASLMAMNTVDISQLGTLV